MKLVMKKLQDNCPVMVTTIPKPIMKEIGVWVKECKKIKNHPLAELKAHENVAYVDAKRKNNSYQVSVPDRLIADSFWLAWTLRLCSKYYGGPNHRAYSLGYWDGHFDGLDLWCNFSYKGDQNPSHKHTGHLSGVIYYQNHDHPTFFDDFNCGYAGTNATMILFPSSVFHHVKEQISSKERITFAFNIDKRDAL